MCRYHIGVTWTICQDYCYFLLEIWQWPAVANVLHISDGHETLGSAKPGVCITIAAISRFGRPISQWVSGFHLKAVLSLVKSLRQRLISGEIHTRHNEEDKFHEISKWLLLVNFIENTCRKSYRMSHKAYRKELGFFYKQRLTRPASGLWQA